MKPGPEERTHPAIWHQQGMIGKCAHGDHTNDNGRYGHDGILHHVGPDDTVHTSEY